MATVDAELLARLEREVVAAARRAFPAWVGEAWWQLPHGVDPVFDAAVVAYRAAAATRPAPTEAELARLERVAHDLDGQGLPPRPRPRATVIRHPRAPEPPRRFRAAAYRTCPACRHGIRVGALVVRRDDGAIIHAEHGA